MQLRYLGETGLLVSPLGLGLAALGRPGYINLGHGDDFRDGRSVETMETQAHEVLDFAWSHGVRYFDAARSYGQAERFLATWLMERSLDPVVGSKWGYTYTADWRVEADVHELKNHSLEVLRKQWHESRHLMGEHLDLYQIHSATLESGVLEDTAVLTELARIKAGGTCIGLTTSGPEQGRVIERALEIRIDGIRLFDTVQSTWNLLETSAGETLQSAHRSGLGVIVKESLANGRLTSRNREPGFSVVKNALESLAPEPGASIDALAIAAVLSRPWVDVVLSGAASTEQLQSNLRATTLTDVWTDKDVQVFREDPRTYWRQRSELPWN